MYIPKQGDMVWIDFEPTRGREIKKRRPALVVSSNLYNEKTHFAILLPITSTFRNEAIYYSLNGYNTKGQVVTTQMRSMDLSVKAGRNAEYIETMRAYDFLQIAQMLDDYFAFDKFVGI